MDIKRGVFSPCFIYYLFNDIMWNKDSRPRALNGRVTSDW